MGWRFLLLSCSAIITLTACADDDAARAAPASVVRSGTTDGSSLALTFDAVGDAGETEAILSLLRGEHVRATFAVAGLWAEEHPALLNAIASDGHQIMNLTYDHTSFTGASTGTPALTQEQRALELSRTETTVFRMSSRSTRPFFRPPFGDFDESVLRDASDAGYRFAVLWSVDARAEEGSSLDAVARTVITQTQPGAVVAMNLSAPTAAALPAILDALKSRGFAFETVAEIIEQP